MTVQLLKEQNKYDQIPSDIFRRLERILPLLKLVEEEIVSEETKILKKFIPRMYEVLHKVAKASCEYVRRGMWSSLRFDTC